MAAVAQKPGGGHGFGGWLIRLSNAEQRRPAELEIRALDPGPPPQIASVRNGRCVFDGTLDDRQELARASGITITAETSDAEAILSAYLRLGESVLEKVKGVFALAVWDGETLLCARDRLGIYPLFMADASGDLLVSTSIKALIAQPDVSAAVNLPVLVDHLRHRWLDVEETFFEAVRRIPAGHALTARGKVRNSFRYWDPAPPDQPVTWVSGDEADRFAHLFKTAVDRSVRAGETGIFLSGGLDSVSVAALATEEDQPKPWALSLAFPDPSCNEEDIQRRVATQLGLPQVMLGWDDAVGPRGLIGSALDLTAPLSAPMINLWAPAYDELARQGRARGCRVIVTGTGGDEWMGVSPYYAADLMRRMDAVGVVRLFLALRRSYPLSLPRHLGNVLWRFGSRPLIRRGAVRIAPGLLTARKRRTVAGKIPAWLAPDGQLRRRLVERELEAYARSLRPLPRLSRTHPAVYVEEGRTALEHPLVSLEFEETFERARGLGMSVLHPFLDSDLVEFLYRTPPEILNRDGRSKGFLRETLHRRLPDLGFASQRKVVTTDFVFQLAAREGLPAWREAGGVPGLVEAGAVDATAVDTMVAGLAAGSPRRDHLQLWDLLSSDVWFRRNGEER